MNSKFYRQLYLEHNWGNNKFAMVGEYGGGFCNQADIHNPVCAGYVLRNSTAMIYRPMFSYSRQELLDTVSVDIKNPTKFWNNIKSRSFVALCKKKRLPVEIVRRIIMHI